MPDPAPNRFYRFDHIDADPRAAPGTPRRLKWEYVCARMDAEEYLRRAKLASPDGRVSGRERVHFMRLLVTAMGISRELLRTLEAAKRAPRYPSVDA